MAKNNPQKAKEYRVVFSQKPSLELATTDLQFQVNKLINERGFQPVGSMVVGPDNQVLQTMVLYVTE